MTDLGLPIKNSSNHITLQGHCEEGKSICRYGERRIEKGEAAVDKSNTHKQEAAEIGADARENAQWRYRSYLRMLSTNWDKE